MKNDDWGNFAIVAHRLKGAVLEVSGDRFCRLITEMEKLAIRRESSLLLMRYMALNEAFEALVLALKQEILR